MQYLCAACHICSVKQVYVKSCAAPRRQQFEGRAGEARLLSSRKSVCQEVAVLICQSEEGVLKCCLSVILSKWACASLLSCASIVARQESQYKSENVC